MSYNDTYNMNMQIMWTETEARNKLSRTGPKEHDSNKATISRLTTQQKVNYYPPIIIIKLLSSESIVNMMNVMQISVNRFIMVGSKTN